MVTANLPFDFCPYKGLQPYTEDDQRYFVGRERDREIIASNLYAAPLTILYGASGVGKSSVLMAGVVPQLRQTPRLAVIVFRSWQDAAASLAMLKSQVIEETSRRADRSLDVDPALPLDEVAFQCASALRGNLFFIFDQFEEYFLYHPPSSTDQGFDAELARTVNRREVHANFLLCLREDGLSKLDRFKGRIPNLLGNMLRLDHLDREAAEAAIRQPLLEYNRHLLPEQTDITIEDDLVHTVVEQVRIGEVTLGTGAAGRYVAALVENPERTGETRIETSYLQLVMTRLWNEERKTKSRILRLATLKRLGNAEQIVRTHLDTTMAQFPESERMVAARVFRFLVTPSGAKIAYAPGDLATYAEVSPTKLLPVMHQLANQDLRVLRALPSKTDQEPRFEIFHDMLAPAILDWRERYLNHARTRRLQLGGAILAVLILIGLVGMLSLWLANFQLAQTTKEQSFVVLTLVPANPISSNATLEPALVAARQTAAAFTTNVVPNASAAPTDTPSAIVVTTLTVTPRPSASPTVLAKPIATLTATPGLPTLSSNARIVFVSNRVNASQFSLHLLDLKTGQVQGLNIPASDRDSVEPHYSKTLDRLVFIRRMQITQKIEERNIFAAGLDGQSLLQLTSGNFDNWDPVWSPDGARIAFVSSRNNSPGNLFVMNADGSGQRPVTSQAVDLLPSWSPDNRKIIFTSNRDGVFHLYTVDVDQGETSVKKMTDGKSAEMYPSWSPDGHQIVFRRIENDTNNDGVKNDLDWGNIWAMNSDGSNAHKLTDLTSIEYAPAWSPDGNWIAFTRYTNGRFGRQIFLMTANGQAIRNVTNSQTEDFWPTWVIR